MLILLGASRKPKSVEQKQSSLLSSCDFASWLCCLGLVQILGLSSVTDSVTLGTEAPRVSALRRALCTGPTLPALRMNRPVSKRKLGSKCQRPSKFVIFPVDLHQKWVVKSLL